MTPLRPLALLLIFAISAQPLAAMGMPCCCAKVASAAKSCCQHQPPAAQAQAKSCCAKHAATPVKLQRGCCCSVERAPATPSRETTVKIDREQLLATPSAAVIALAIAPRPAAPQPPVQVAASPPSVNVLYCTWQI
jgi:hypothetical protein